LLSIFLVHYALSGKAVYGDGVGYYAHLHEWTFDNDWNYTNEYKHIYSPENNNADNPQSVDVVQIVGVTKNGRAANHFFPGTALLLLPYYLLADGVVQLLSWIGVHIPRNGYADIYQIFTGIGSILYLVIGLWCLEKLVLFFFNDKPTARTSVLAVFLSTPLLYYGSYDVINSHAISFFLSSLFFYILLTKNNFSVILLAVTAGLAIMTRVQDMFLAGIFVIQTALKVVSKEERLVETGKKFLLFFAVVILIMVPLYLYWFETFGSFTQHTYIQAFLKERGSNPCIDWIGSIFDTRNGLFIKSPLLLLLFGWYVHQCSQQKKFLYWQLALFFLFQYLIISLQGGWKAAAYGGRMYISSLPFFAVILGSIFRQFPKQQSVKIISVLLLAVCINVITIVTFILFTKDAHQDLFFLELNFLTDFSRYQ
jgi:hypothetical protein